MATSLTTSLTTGAARTLATTTKTEPHTASTTPRHLLAIMEWTELPGGTYRRTSTLRRTIARAGSSQPGVVVAAGHVGEPEIPGMYVEYGHPPREYELAAAQTIMRVHRRVGDLYNDPHDQYEQQLRLTLDALAERKELDIARELLQAPPERHRITTNQGPPTPLDLDNLICKQTSPRFLLAHPRAIAAFSRECSRFGVQPGEVEFQGRRVLGWRGLPFLPCDKLPIAADHTTSILVVRPGEKRQGVVGLRPSENPVVRELGTSRQAVTSYLVSEYYAVAVLIPNAVCALDGVQVVRTSTH
ncbi:hypothetical protein [Herbidospora mongoliensis]|uniref:hypothetical protein n=1 Tax=Herbidospora mongoliensis TaxID=688067 RepID=UPI000834C335|nr:hypothetical protein [Herbidospora mongoliensis]